MPEQLQTIVCQRCGRGFTLTDNYRTLRARRGAAVVEPVLCPTCFLNNGPLPKEHGKVKWFNPHKHYGFIVTEEGEEVFFHQRQVLEGTANEAQEGQTARFHLRYAEKGPEALNVELGKR
jgi:CspA family cold shock protein